MTAFDLHQGFRLGDWQVEPGERRIRRIGNGAVEQRRLSERQSAALLHLAARHGGLVTLAELAQATGCHGDDADLQVHEVVAGLRALLGDFGEQASYVLAVGTQGYSLIRAPHPPGASVPSERAGSCSACDRPRPRHRRWPSTPPRPLRRPCPQCRPGPPSRNRACSPRFATTAWCAARWATSWSRG